MNTLKRYGEFSADLLVYCSILSTALYFCGYEILDCTA